MKVLIISKHTGRLKTSPDPLGGMDRWCFVETAFGEHTQYESWDYTEKVIRQPLTLRSLWSGQNCRLNKLPIWLSFSVKLYPSYHLFVLSPYMAARSKGEGTARELKKTKKKLDESRRGRDRKQTKEQRSTPCSETIHQRVWNLWLSLLFVQQIQREREGWWYLNLPADMLEVRRTKKWKNRREGAP